MLHAGTFSKIEAGNRDSILRVVKATQRVSGCRQCGSVSHVTQYRTWLVKVGAIACDTTVVR